MSLGDRYKLTLVSQSGSTTVNNVFHYRQTLGVLGGEILAQEFINEVYPHIRSIVSNQIVFQRVEWINYDDLADFGEDDSIAGEGGERPGTTLPRFNVWSFIYNRTTRATRNGWKRFSTVAEDDQDNGAATAAMLLLLQDAANGLEQFVNFGGTEIWRPIIVRLDAKGSTILEENNVRSVTYRRLSTQNSRKGW